MAPFFTGAILLLDIQHVLFPSNQLLSHHVTWSISSTSIGYCCACQNLHHYDIVFDHCWKFYPKSLVEIINVGVGTAIGKTDIYYLMGATVFLIWI